VATAPVGDQLEKTSLLACVQINYLRYGWSSHRPGLMSVAPSFLAKYTFK
jgi:hypothetical protein